MMSTVPRYISTFELEEARLGQALQANQTILDKDIHREILTTIKDQSINIEFAIYLAASSLKFKKDTRYESLEKILMWLEQRKKSGPQ